MGKTKSTKKGAKKGSVGSKGKGNKGKQTDAEAEAFKAEAVAYAKRAYDTALAHYGQHHADPFALSRLAVVYDETSPQDLHMVVTLPGVIDNSYITEKNARDAMKDAELLARTLEHPKCPDAFKTAFGAIFTEHILNDSDVSITTPELVRVALPLVLFGQWLAADGSGVTPTEILVTLSCELVDDEVDRDMRSSLGMQ